MNGFQRHKVRAWTTYDFEMGRACPRAKRSSSLRGSKFFQSSSRFDLALNYDVPVYKKLRPWLKCEVRNMFNDQSLIAFNTTITPDPNRPLDKDGLPTGFIRGSRFAQGTSKNDYPLARTFVVSIGFRF